MCQRVFILWMAWSLIGFISAQKTMDLWPRLKAGNERFVSEKLQSKALQQERIQLQKSQQPYAIILTCADSRVSPELIFDEGIGKLFVVRVAGNVVSPEVLGSIEYAAEHLHSSCLLVLGHEGCGAVQAALKGRKTSPGIQSLIKKIRPAVRQYSEEELAKAVVANVKKQVQNLGKSSILQELVTHHQLQVWGGVYSFQTGKVELLQENSSFEEVSDKKNAKKHSKNKDKEPKREFKKIRI